MTLLRAKSNKVRFVIIVSVDLVNKLSESSHLMVQTNAKIASCYTKTCRLLQFISTTVLVLEHQHKREKQVIDRRQ